MARPKLSPAFKMRLLNFKNLILIILFSGVFALPLFGQAETIEELQVKINEQNSRIVELEQEIAIYEKTLAETEVEAKTLANTVSELDTTRKKLEAKVRLTEKQITGNELEIEKQELELGETRAEIDLSLVGLGEIIKTLRVENDRTFVEVVLSGKTLSESFTEVETIKKLGVDLKRSLDRLEVVRGEFEARLAQLLQSQKKLIALREQLNDERATVVATRSEQALLLSETRNKESNYRKILTEKEALRAEFEKELTLYESKLRIAIDPKSLPKTGTGVLSWPLEKVFITQYFGNTEFAKAGAYNGKGHNGIDLRASIGTAVFAAADGVVTGSGDTDIGCPRGSYGKWVLINHLNGLSSVYGHLSLVKAVPGAQVKQGDIIGYSGNTGYSTGPHLHLTVFATAGVKITSYVRPDGTTSKCGAIPLAPLNAYLNPLLYLYE